MKKCIAAVLLVSLLLGVGLFIRRTPLASMDRRFTAPKTGTSEVSFDLERGDTVRLSLTSTVRDGDYHAAVYSADGVLVEDIGKAKQLEMFLTPGEAGTYCLRVEFDGFVGSLKAKIYR